MKDDSKNASSTKNGSKRPSEKDKKESWFSKMKEGGSSSSAFATLSKNRLMWLLAIVMLAGIIITFYSSFFGGFLVGLAFGLCFHKDIRRFFERIKLYATNEGLFKIALIFGVLFFALLTIPSFILATAIGFLIVMLLTRARKKY